MCSSNAMILNQQGLQAHPRRTPSFLHFSFVPLFIAQKLDVTFSHLAYPLLSVCMLILHNEREIS